MLRTCADGFNAFKDKTFDPDRFVYGIELFFRGAPESRSAKIRHRVSLAISRVV